MSFQRSRGFENRPMTIVYATPIPADSVTVKTPLKMPPTMINGSTSSGSTRSVWFMKATSVGHGAAQPSQDHLKPDDHVRQHLRAIGEDAEHDEQGNCQQRKRIECVVEPAHQDRRLHALEKEYPGRSCQPHAEGDRHANDDGR